MTINIPNVIKEDWPRKLTALVFASMIWYSISLQNQSTRVINDVRLKLSLPANVIALNQDTIPNVTITVRGSNRNLDSFRNNNIRVELKIKDNVPLGTYQTFLRKDAEFDLPGDVSLVTVEPESFMLQLDKVIEAQLPVKARFSGNPPEGMELIPTVITPNSVTVTGPTTYMKGLRDIQTRPIPLGKDMPEEFDYQAELVNPNPDIFTLSRDSVDVIVGLIRINGEQYFQDLPLHVIDVPTSDLYIAEYIDPPNPSIQLVIEGPKIRISSLRPEMVRPFIDISDIREPEVRTLPIDVWIDMPECKVRPMSMRPTAIRVRIANRPTK